MTYPSPPFSPALQRLQEQARQDFAEVRQLQDGWDTYDGSPPTASVIDAAQNFLQDVYKTFGAQ